MSRKNPLSSQSNKHSDQFHSQKPQQAPSAPTIQLVHDESACYLDTQNPEAVKYLQPVTVPIYIVPPDEEVVDIDAMDYNNPYTVSMYASEAYEHLNELQHRLKPNENYMQRQLGISARQRSMVVNWMIQIHKDLSTKYQTSLQADTLFISISLLDRFLSLKVIAPEKLNIVALGCFFIAAKFEETYYPSVEQLLVFAKGVATKEDLLKTERIILGELNYSLGCPTALTFLKRYAKAANADSTIGMVARFLAEYSMMSYRLATHYLPSQIAAAALSHALAIVGRAPWTATLEHYTGYSHADIHPVLVEMKQWVRKAPLLQTQVAFMKYSSQKYLKASVLALVRI